MSTSLADMLALTPIERFPAEECAAHVKRCRAILRVRHPEAGGLLLCGKTHIFYVTGTLGTGLLWLPIEGDPVLMLRKGCERARLESPLKHIVPFKSYREVPDLVQAAGSPLTEIVAVDKNNFSWAKADMLMQRLPGLKFVGGDDVPARARAVKTAREIDIMRACGQIHARIMDELLPARIRPGMTEAAIAAAFAEECLKNGSDSLCRTNAHGEEMFYGYASCGNNGLYPTCYNGPLGCRGMHPAVPFLGSRDVLWQKNQLISVDMGCQKGGYHTDRTQCYWSGTRQSVPRQLNNAHKACVDILDEAREALRPGTTPASLWEQAQASAARLGLREGFMGLGPDQVSFLGHGIGLTLDEWPALARSFNEPLEENMVIALEPKISLPGFGMTGVEHTFLVTKDGAEALTGACSDIICIQ